MSPAWAGRALLQRPTPMLLVSMLPLRSVSIGPSALSPSQARARPIIGPSPLQAAMESRGAGLGFPGIGAVGAAFADDGPTCQPPPNAR